MEHGEKQITVIDEQGNEILCEVLFTFESEEFGKSYVLYYPVSDENEDEEDIEIHASSFSPSEDGEDGELQPIETEEEWDLVEEMLNTFLDEEGEE
ncbi:DUF1292 domain-containing protein [Bacillus sp. HNG]|uniref:DUF1292 domain-containing protein n=1 Tax=Bacillaceae TaxID=186817 RepID=UPI000E2FBD59|nr:MULTISPECIES: DUF1292 domain-containing protein [Bacillaceae]MDR4889047.1 DUF1292 domain-containing protein [Fredinandcohnia sp. QZ13]RFB17623.1 DUF1292 domain-containing protein [Bacillus sp. HNG]